MNDEKDLSHETLPEPKSATGEKPPIRKSQEEFIGDMAAPSKDKSEIAPDKKEQGAR